MNSYCDYICHVFAIYLSWKGFLWFVDGKSLCWTIDIFLRRLLKNTPTSTCFGFSPYSALVPCVGGVYNRRRIIAFPPPQMSFRLFLFR